MTAPAERPDEAGATPLRPAQNIDRIVVMALDSLHSAVAVHRFVDAYGDRVVGVVSSAKIQGAVGEGLLTETVKYFRKSGSLYLAYLSAMQVLFRPVAHVARVAGRLSRRPQRAFTLGQVCRPRGLRIVRARNINSPDTVRRIADMKPDLIVLLYFDQILKDDIIAVPRYGVLNIHPGLLPQNRGPVPGFWAIRLQHEEIGATAHLIDSARIDAGPILGMRSVARDPRKSVVGVDCEAMRLGAELAVEAVRDIEAGTAAALDQDDAASAYYRDPSRGELRQFWRQGGRLFRLSDYFDQFFDSRRPT